MSKPGSDTKKPRQPWEQRNDRERYDPEEWRFKERHIEKKPYLDGLQPEPTPLPQPETRLR